MFIFHGDPLSEVSRDAVMFCSGPWFRYLIDYIALSPFTTLFFIGYLAHKALQRDAEWRIVLLAGYFISIFLFFAVIMHFKEIRFLIHLEMVVVLFAVLFLIDVFRQKRLRNQALLVLVSSVLIYFVNYKTFSDVICAADIYDPVSYEILSVLKIIP